MHTRIINVRENIAFGVEEGARLIKSGALVAFPTETVYGLGANALDPLAVKGIFAAKGRPGDNPLIAHVDGPDMAMEIARVTPAARKLMDFFWPGPLTLVLGRRGVPDEVTAGLDTVAVRMPDNAAALGLITASGGPVAAPSANKSGKPSPTCAAHVLEDMRGLIPLVLDGGECGVGVESTVLALGSKPVILRPGAVTADMLEGLIGPVALAAGAFSPVDGGKALSPGMKYTHYAPAAQVILFEGSEGEIAKKTADCYKKATERGRSPIILCTSQTYRFYAGLNCDIIGDKAWPYTLLRSLYGALRRADKGHDLILLEGVPKSGVGSAYMNRALRAAGFHVK